MAVVTTREFDDLATPCKAASEADGAHCCFRAATCHPDFFDRWIKARDKLRHLNLGLAGRAETRAVFNRFFQRGADLVVIVAVDRRPPSAYVVDELPAIDGMQTATFRARGEKRRSANAPKRANGGIDAAWDHAQGSRKKI